MGLRAASLFTGISHIVALAFAGAFLRGGTPDGGDLVERAAFVADHEPQWVAGWMLFVIAGGGLLWWMILLRQRLDIGPSMQFAVLLTAVGLALECVAHGLSSGLLPALAEQNDLAAFAATEDTIRMFALVLGQAGFGTGALLAVLSLRKAQVVGTVTLAAGYINVTASAAAIAAALANEPAIAGPATALLIVALFVLSVGVGRSEWARD
jgi:hypothetical protein